MNRYKCSKNRGSPTPDHGEHEMQKLLNAFAAYHISDEKNQIQHISRLHIVILHIKRKLNRTKKAIHVFSASFAGFALRP